jgi:hypothetical protein
MGAAFRMLPSSGDRSFLDPHEWECPRGNASLAPTLVVTISSILSLC